ncbi:NAD(P) transhydrogenase subunit alpha [Dehalobacterium formicoaceticum]|uniref:proton-translocating NAD(P)(+) transhydrogenase n=1 Tax=Dehalobacterium formicoaceticum TaxID=51515 RepID=A0ABT1Y1C3_9FIRM|nr:NAD(P) transhydrogenase subunit alpha [Dehalobacterium formicoaceticum]MCR6544656.1 NAD(P) transhydrogenase subunit alpha [Dehalobacterium formicoaceticum]
MKFQGLTLGVPTEIMPGERRVAAIPETVKKMVAEGAKVIVEKGAGDGSYFADADYQAAGAVLVDKAQAVYDQSDIILKVKEPLMNNNTGKHEIEMMKKGQVLVTFIHPASPVNHEMVKAMSAKGIVAFTLDGVPRISRAQNMDALTSMSTVAGYKAVLLAANRLSKFMPMVGTAVGMIKPANVLVIGTGVAGLQAVATAKRMGAVVTAADIRPAAREQAQSLGAKILDLGIPDELAVAEGGYANRLSDEWLVKEREALKAAVADSDILVLTALIPGKIAPILITEDMVKSMRPGSAIVDVSIDQGGNCEMTDPGKVFELGGINIDGTKNIPGMMPTSSTWMFSHNIYNYVANLCQDGKVNINLEDEILAQSLVCKDCKLVHAGTLEAMNM